MGKDEGEGVCVWGRREERKGGGGEGYRGGKGDVGGEGKTRGMCVRTGVNERLSSTINQGY